jgi:hypothetical protein
MEEWILDKQDWQDNDGIRQYNSIELDSIAIQLYAWSS